MSRYIQIFEEYVSDRILMKRFKEYMDKDDIENVRKKYLMPTIWMWELGNESILSYAIKNKKYKILKYYIKTIKPKDMLEYLTYTDKNSKAQKIILNTFFKEADLEDLISFLKHNKHLVKRYKRQIVNTLNRVDADKVKFYLIKSMMTIAFDICRGNKGPEVLDIYYNETLPSLLSTYKTLFSKLTLDDILKYYNQKDVINFIRHITLMSDYNNKICVLEILGVITTKEIKFLQNYFEYI